MQEHRAKLRWTRTSADFRYDTYNRAHEAVFKDGAVVLPSSSAPEFRGDADRVDPEEAFVAALSGCHMLTFLAICAHRRIVPDSYEDEAGGVLEKGADGKLWLARVTLRPRVRFAPGTRMDQTLLDGLHHQAHADCFIANSVKTEVSVVPAL